MTGATLALAVAFAIFAGAYIGWAHERYKRGKPGETPNRYVTDARLSKLHVIHDEWSRPGITVRERRDER